VSQTFWKNHPVHFRELTTEEIFDDPWFRIIFELNEQETNQEENIQKLTKIVNALQDKVKNGETLSSIQQEQLIKAQKKLADLQRSQINNEKEPNKLVPWLIVGGSLLILIGIILLIKKKKSKR